MAKSKPGKPEWPSFDGELKKLIAYVRGESAEGDIHENEARRELLTWYMTDLWPRQFRRPEDGGHLMPDRTTYEEYTGPRK